MESQTRTRRRVPAVLTLGLLVVGGCERAGVSGYVVTTDSAGVAIWTWGPEPAVPDLALERVGAFAVPDSGWTIEADGVAVDRERGRVYVLDEAAPRLLMFDADGTFLEQVGRDGEGPGEYVLPMAVTTDEDGGIHVVDASRSLLLSWTRDGRYEGQSPLIAPYWGPGLAMTLGELVYVNGRQDGKTGSVTETLLRTSPDQPAELASLVQPWVPVSLPCGNMPVPKVMAPSLVWGSNDRYTVVSVWPDYVLQVFDADSLAASLRRPIPGRDVSESEATASIPEGPQGFLLEACGMSASQVIKAVGFVESASVIEAIALDPANRIWVRRAGAAGTGKGVDVFDPGLGYVGSFRDSQFPLAFLSESRFLAISEKPWGTALEVWQFQLDGSADAW